ncbi:MAG: Crp/Fnr family transcriptional regulator [Candidatus Doudnabacteria bacterium]|nr:Crp/Fnr family transcriptional regulator [Candidatus Doudnabacteria bacterium]
MIELSDLKQLAPAVLEELNRLCVKKTFQKGDMIYFPGEETERIFLLLSGEVKLYQSSAGNKVVLEILKAGQFFGDLNFAHQGYNFRPEIFAQSEMDTTLCAMSTADFNQVLNKYPALAMMVLTSLRNRLHLAESKIKDLATSPAEVRVINELIRYSLNHGQETNGFLVLEEKLTHQFLADMTGMARETVSKTLQALAKTGLIEYSPDRLIKLNIEKISKSCPYCLRLQKT